MPKLFLRDCMSVHIFKIRVRFFHDSPATLLHGFIYEFIFPLFFFYRLLNKTQVHVS